MSRGILLTGGSGLVGQYLIRDLLLKGHPLTVVMRSSQRRTAQQRLEQILHHWEAELGRALPRATCFEGDVSAAGLGLDRAERQWIARHCDRVLHNAAVLKFFGPDRHGEPWQTNVEGTRHVLQLCHEARIRQLHYVSTAYVCGDRQGLIRESELDCGQSFRNDYEHSKFLGEMLARSDGTFDSVTVYRPAVIAGDSRTGYTSSYHGLYLYLKLISMFVHRQVPDANGIRHVPIRLYLGGDEPRNVVPVDWVSAVICRFIDRPDAHGGTYHLAPQTPITPREVIEAAQSYYRSTCEGFCNSQAPIENAANDIERHGYAASQLYQSYDRTDPRFDTTELQRFAADLPCPSIDVATIHRYIRFGEADQWGKRRAAKSGDADGGPARLRAGASKRSVDAAGGS